MRTRPATGKGKFWRRRLICLALVFGLFLAALVLSALLTEPPAAPESPDIWGSGTSESTPPAPAPAPALPEPSQGYSAMWISYLEWESVDFSTEESFTAAAAQMAANCANLGLRTMIVQMRPFGDALYRSELFPPSHLLTGTQGEGVEYDPLTILTNAAHAAGLRIEAWINPYRVRLNDKKPGALSADNPAAVWLASADCAGYVHEAGGGLYYDPGVPAVRQLIVDGVREIVQNYDVDGVLFDDYFYPTTDAAFDAEAYAAYGGGQGLEEWRRQNVNELVQAVYREIKALDPACTFGISPQGNIENNISQQYSDVALWLAEPGYVDYLMPQIYWGFGYVTGSGSTAFAFENCLGDWAALPRAASVELYAALGAYRIGAGDGCEATAEEWNSGENLAKQVLALQGRAGGFSLYRYDFLYTSPAQEALVTKELAALQSILLPKP